MLNRFLGYLFRHIPLFYCFPLHYEYVCSLAILDEDVVIADIGDCVGSNLGHFLGHGLDMVEVYVG